MIYRSQWSAIGRFTLYMVVGAVVLELLLRSFYLSPSRRVLDPVIGPRYEAGQEILSASEGFARNRTNSLGLLDEEIRSPKPALRVLLLGDSFVEARHVFPDQRMDSVAETLLGPDAEIINAGHASWGPADAIPFVNEYGSTLDPDLLVLFLSEEDLEQLTSGGKSHLVRDGDAWRVQLATYSAATSPLRRASRWLTRRSSLATLLRRRAQTLADIETRRLRAKFAQTSDAEGDQEGSWVPRVSTAMLRALTTPILATGRPLLLVYLPRGRYLTPEGMAGETELARCMREFVSESPEGRVGFLDPTAALEAEYERTRRPGHGFQNSIYGSGHLNARGHRILGRLLAREIERMTR